ATPASPNQSSNLAMTISGSHWVGTQCAVACDVTEPGSRSDQLSRDSRPKRRWEQVCGLLSGPAKSITATSSTVASSRAGRMTRTIEDAPSAEPDSGAGTAPG